MAESADFLTGDDLEALFLSLEDDPFDKNELFPDNILVEMSGKDDVIFECNSCAKICKSQRGLTRHQNSMHGDQKNRNPSAVTSITSTRMKDFVDRCAMKIVSKGYYPPNILEELEKFTISLEDAAIVCEKFQEIIGIFKGNSEEFLPKFFKIVNNGNIFAISRMAAVLIGYELGPMVLGYLNKGDRLVEHSSTNMIEDHSLSKRDIDIVAYISGYVFSTFYRRIRNADAWRSNISQLNLSILKEGKKEDAGHISEDDSSLIRLKNRGGLWFVKDGVISLFVIVEKYFCMYTSSNVKNIDSREIVAKVLANSEALCYYFDLCEKANPNIDREIATDLLEHLVMLYVRVRSFSYAKDKIQQYKINRHKTKSKSLRTEIKKASSNLTHGK